jgi:hypothetical protein
VIKIAGWYLIISWAVGFLATGAVVINTQRSAQIMQNTTGAATGQGMSGNDAEGFTPNPGGNYILCDDNGQNCKRVSEGSND